MSDSNSTAVKFCKKCQCDTERYNNGRCRPCACRNAKEWGLANEERKRANLAKWHANNAAYVKECKAKNYLENAEANRAKAAMYYAVHSVSAKAYAREKRALNKDAAIARAIEWRKKNPEKSRLSSARWQRNKPNVVVIIKANRRARKCAVDGNLSSDLKSKLFTLQRGKCACCGLPLGSNYHMDHIMPLALGGSNTDDNIQLLRQRCNNQKYSKHPIDFMQSRGFLL